MVEDINELLPLAATATLRHRLEAVGFQGEDTLGFLKFFAQEIRVESHEVYDSPSHP